MTRTDPMIGQVVGGRYQVTTLLGKGGMGAVYAVRHLKMSRTFAMKTLSPDVLDDAEVVARFKREAEIIAALRHPNIVEIVDWDSLPDGAPYMVMEHLRGEELSARLSVRGPLPWTFIARIADQVLSALTVAHRAGIVHRDLKPDNIFLSMDDTGDEHAKLLDFGVSKMGGSDSKLTGFNRLIGTPAYMSPEQADGRTHETGPETDVWAMGAIVYEMATAQMAFGAATVPSILYRICHDVPDPMRAFRPDTPGDVEDVILRALSRDRERRISSADDLRVALRGALGKIASVAYDDRSGPIRLPDASRGPTTAPHPVQEATAAHTPLPESFASSSIDGDLASMEAFEPTVQAPPPPAAPPRAALLKTIPEAPAPVVPPEFDPRAPSAPRFPSPPRIHTPTTLTRASGVSVAVRRPRRRAAGIVAVASVLLVAAVVGGVVVSQNRRPSTIEAQATDVPDPSASAPKPELRGEGAPSPATPDPVAAPPANVPPATATAATATAPAATATAPAATPAPTAVVVRVRSKPEAVAHVGDRKLGKTPIDVPVPAGERVRVRLRASGYRTIDVDLDGSKTTVVVNLVRKPDERVGPLPIGP